MIEIARLATETGYFPLYEWDKDRLVINPPSDYYMKKENRKPLKEFIKAQSRFSHISDEEIKELEKDIDEFLNYLWRLSLSSGIR
ncbi:hypothetical protein [Vulcanisaeta thermophila]|uniref:hypothetical protein n=1 Tax=Vulcanisaeta thermophila TaxID=867917 RepID=UPI0008530A1F|nr:hypothetical protein [Vulcanisaeta thermophila]